MLGPVSDIALRCIRRPRELAMHAPPGADPWLHGLEAARAGLRGVTRRIARELQDHLSEYDPRMVARTAVRDEERPVVRTGLAASPVRTTVAPRFVQGAARLTQANETTTRGGATSACPTHRQVGRGRRKVLSGS